MNIYIKEDAFNRIVSGNKTVESRRYRGIFRDMNEGMIISFICNNNSKTALVKKINIYDNINNLLKYIDISKVGDNIDINKYRDILNICYQNFDGMMITIEFNLI